MSDVPEPDRQKTPRRDARLEGFLRRAAPILAAERGLTPQASVKLRTIADEMQLSEELRQQAWELLQQGPPTARHYSRYERAFAAYLKKQFEGRNGSIVTYDVEQKALRVAADKYQLDGHAAREILGEVVRKLGLRRISMTEAERHVETTAREVIGDAVWVDIDTRQRLVELGEEWGVAKEQVAAIVEFLCRGNRERRRRQQVRNNLFVALGAIAILAALGTFMSLSWDRIAGRAEPIEEVNGKSDPVAAGGAFRPPAWWNDPMRTAVGNALARVAGFDDWGRDLASSEPSRRDEAYRRLVALLANRHDQPETRRRLEAIVAEVLAGEPDDAAFDRILSELLGLAKPPTDGLPGGDDFYRRGASVITFVATFAGEVRHPAARRDRTLEALGQLTGTVAAADDPALLDRALVDYFGLCRERLLGAAVENPGTGVQRFDQLMTAARDRVDDAERGRWTTELLVELLRNSPSEWARYRQLIETATSKGNQPNVPALLEFLEAPADRALAEHLADRLRTTYRLTVEDRSPEEVAAALRRQLGLSAAVISRATPALWNRLAGRVPPDRGNELDRLSRVERGAMLAELSQLATIAVRLIATPDRGKELDQSLRDKLASIESTEPSGEPAELPSSDESAAATRQLVNRIDALDDANLSVGLQTLRTLGARLKEGVSLEGERDAAARVAAYLLTPRAAADQQRVLAEIADLGRWTDLIFAIVDALSYPETRVDVAADVVAAIRSDSGLSLDGRPTTPIDLQQQLLEHLLARSETEATSIGPAPDPTAAAVATLDRLLVETYRQRTLALAPAGTTPAMSSAVPGEAIEQAAREWLRWSLADRPELSEAPAYREFERRLAAAYYLAADDLQGTVAVQRCWIDLVGAWVVRRQPEKAAEAERTIENYRKRCAGRTDGLDQLIDGERTLLQLWMMIR